MARAIRSEDGVVVGLREHLAASCRAIIGKLEHATDTELYDFTVELDRQRDRLIDIQTGRDVLVYRFEVPESMQPPRDHQHVFTLRGDWLVPAEYERVSPSVGEFG